jgi:hypothetical protein
MQQSERIEDNPAALAKFTELARGERFRAAFGLLHERTIDEETLHSLNVDGLAREIRLWVSAYEPQLSRKILLETIHRPPHLTTNDRAAYQVRHLDMMEDFAGTLQALERHNVHATRGDISPEFAAWAEERLPKPGFHERIRRHIDLGERA